MSTVLILGASSDMAIALARVFADNKFNIQLAARRPEELSALRSDLQIRKGITCTVHPFDATNYASHESFFSALSPKPDICICLFGYLGENEKARSDWKEASDIMATNYVGAVSILNIVSLYYQQQQKGTIVGISSVAGERGRQSNYIYGSAKAGFTAYLAGLRNRMFREKVHVLSVQPGFVYTRMTANLNLPKLLTAQPEDVANAVYKAVIKKKNVIYVKWFWRWIMLMIKCIPEPMFKKLKM
jgi:decaprenylphospho-beta-D-erythro-pentofuranosid-2-ulose 2-reductase